MKRLRRLLVRISPVLLGFVLAASTAGSGFKSQQMQYPRVKAAFAEKEKQVKALFESEKLKLSNSQIFIRAFKEEKRVEVWARPGGAGRFRMVQTYPVCASSGTLGPKRRRGDYQVPEGFYHIDRFNPQSNFHLSLGLNYPNAADRLRSGKADPGDDIFIHGDCVTVGCIPLTDDKVKELYVMAVEARNGGQVRIPVHIFPARLTPENWKRLQRLYRNDTTRVSFWAELKPVYEYFETYQQLPPVQIGSQGQYRLAQSGAGRQSPG